MKDRRRQQSWHDEEGEILCTKGIGDDFQCNIRKKKSLERAGMIFKYGIYETSEDCKRGEVKLVEKIWT